MKRSPAPRGHECARASMVRYALSLLWALSLLPMNMWACDGRVCSSAVSALQLEPTTVQCAERARVATGDFLQGTRTEPRILLASSPILLVLLLEPLILRLQILETGSSFVHLALQRHREICCRVTFDCWRLQCRRLRYRPRRWLSRWLGRWRLGFGRWRRCR